MFKINTLSILSLFFVLAIVGCSSIVMAANDLTQSAQPAESPPAVVENFYSWLLDYIGDRSSGEFHNPLVERAYRHSEYLSHDFVSRLDEMLDAGQPLTHDPLLCAQDVPQYVEVLESTVTGQRAALQMGSSFPNHSFSVELVQIDGRWLIENIGCQ